MEEPCFSSRQCVRRLLAGARQPAQHWRRRGHKCCTVGITRRASSSTCTATSSRPSSCALRWALTASDAYLAKPLVNEHDVCVVSAVWWGSVTHMCMNDTSQAHCIIILSLERRVSIYYLQNDATSHPKRHHLCRHLPPRPHPRLHRLQHLSLNLSFSLSLSLSLSCSLALASCLALGLGLGPILSLSLSLSTGRVLCVASLGKS